MAGRGEPFLLTARVDACMKTRGGSEEAKRRAAEAAADVVTDGMTVGLGTGSTTAYAIQALGTAVGEGLDIQGVATSFQARKLARDVGIPLVSLGDTTTVDLAIDGADQVAGMDLLKGGGAAHAREKIVAQAADAFHVVVDESKLTDQLDQPVPVEILPAARSAAGRQLEALGGDPQVREATGKDGPVITDNGNLVIDCDFGTIPDPTELANALATVAGVVEQGLFVDEVTAIHIGTASGVEKRRT